MTDRLILIPTPLERSQLGDGLASVVGANDVVELCGFGLAVAGARTAELIARYRPSAVVLLGIAGGYGDLPVGKAFEFTVLQCMGIGVGRETDTEASTSDPESFQSACSLGWPQFDGEAIRIGDRIQLSNISTHQYGLLSATTSSATASQARRRSKSNPGFVAEDMESFSVAAACTLSGVDLRVIRGISNQAGNREHSTWQTKEALQSVIEYLRAHPTRETS